MPRSLSELYVALIKRSFASRFAFSRLTRVPVLKRAIGKAFFDGDDMMILPRDNAARVIDLDIEVDAGRDVVLPSDVLKEMIRGHDGATVMRHCICRDSNGCEDYPRELGCVFLGPGASRIPESLGRRVSTAEALEHVQRCQDAGLVHLIGRNKLDSLWLNTGPKEELLTICNCCPCCCLWKMIPFLDDDLGRSIKPMPGVSVEVGEGCIGCGKCAEGSCFVDAITLSEGRAQINNEMCRACGRCAELCPRGAIVLKFEGDSMDEAVKRLAPLLDGAPLEAAPPKNHG